jgi:hypothetical protein
MAIEISARAEPPQRDAQQERDYQAFSTALSASARGRTFLAEYTRRNRNADTELLLAAIDKLQGKIAANKAARTSEPVRSELHALLKEISAARDELDASILTMKATKLAELVALVERRLTNIVAALPADREPEIEPDLPDVSVERVEKPERMHLAVVPPPDQPELPIPSPVATSLPPIMLVHTETAVTEVVFGGEPVPAPLQDHSHEPVVVELPKLDSAIASGIAAASVPSSARKIDALASIMALSEDERLALFT